MEVCQLSFKMYLVYWPAVKQDKSLMVVALFFLDKAGMWKHGYLINQTIL
jgi:hypothetical protein